MNASQLNDIVENRLNTCRDVLTSAGREYSDAENDRLSNFKSIAEFIVRATGKRTVEVTPELVWLIYYLKHVVTLTKAATGQALTRESAADRVTDAVNYPLLFEALDAESKHEAVEAAFDATYDVPAPSEAPTEAEPTIRERFRAALGGR